MLLVVISPHTSAFAKLHSNKQPGNGVCGSRDGKITVLPPYTASLRCKQVVTTHTGKIKVLLLLLTMTDMKPTDRDLTTVFEA